MEEDNGHFGNILCDSFSFKMWPDFIYEIKRSKSEASFEEKHSWIKNIYGQRKF